MKTIGHPLPRGTSMLTVAQWCREHDTPVVIRFPEPRVPPLQEMWVKPVIITVTGKSIIRGLKGKTFPGPPKRGLWAIVRERDFDLFRLRF